MVLLSTREALRTVRFAAEGSYALGATKWQTIWYQYCPWRFRYPDRLILALSGDRRNRAAHQPRALTYVPFLPIASVAFHGLPIQIFNWVSRPQVEFAQNAAGAIIVLLALLLTMNATAIWLRDRFQKRRVS